MNTGDKHSSIFGDDISGHDIECELVLADAAGGEGEHGVQALVHNTSIRTRLRIKLNERHGRILM